MNIELDIILTHYIYLNLRVLPVTLVFTDVNSILRINTHPDVINLEYI